MLVSPVGGSANEYLDSDASVKLSALRANLADAA
jgi:hypothetical protein